MKNKTIKKNFKWLWITLITFIIVLFTIIFVIISENWKRSYEFDFERSNCTKVDVDWKCDNTPEEMEKCYENMRKGGANCRNSCTGTPIYKCRELIMRLK